MKLGRRGVAAAFCVAATLTLQPTPAYADATRDKQWQLDFLDVTQAHKYSQGQGVTVAVIDSGVDAGHPDLSGNVLQGVDITAGRIGSGNGQRDSEGHGTGMAGLIAAHGHGTNVGALGIAPQAKILPIQAVTDLSGGVGKATPDDIAQAINFAVDRHAAVINLSVGVLRSSSLRDALERAHTAGIVVVASAGNTDSDVLVPYPGGAEGVLTVGATDRNGNHASISVSGRAVVIAAPGVDITSTNKGGGYRTGTGTSDATAIVSGAVALVRAKYPDLSADEVIHRLTATATDKGPPGRDEQYGYGVLDLVAALTADVPASPGNAQAGGSPTGDPGSAPPSAEAAPTPGSDTSSDGGSANVFVTVVLLAILAIVVVAFLVVRQRRRTGGPV